VQEAKEGRKARLVVVDPRFTRSAAVSDYYAPIRAGSDIAFLSGLIHYLLEHDKIQHEYVKAHTNAPFLIDPAFGFENGLFTGYNAEKRNYDKASWRYQMGEDGFARVDPTLQDPNCVFQLMKKHFSRYNADVVSSITGTPKDAFLKVCEMVAECSASDRTMTILYALGWTQHSVGSQNIRTMAMIQLLLGNMGMAGGGINALRGHANVQGITDMCLFGDSLPGYMHSPTEAEATLDAFLTKRTPRMLRPGQMNYWSNYSKFFVSLMKAFYGPNATADNNFGYDWLPKMDGAYDVLALFERMHQGRMNGFVCQGFNPLASVSNKAKVSSALSKLKYLVVMDPLATDTSEFWKDYGELNKVDPTQIQTEVFRLPAALFAEHEGSFTNSGRVIQWHWKAADGPGETREDTAIMGELFTRLRTLYATEGGANPEPILKLHWPYRIPSHPSSQELAREISGYAISDLADASGTVTVKAGEQVAGFGVLRNDGSTACGNWLYSGMWSQAGNLTARRDNSDPSGLGQTLNWGYAWPANRRILYNRASCDASGKPWDPARTVIKWNGKAWGGNDVPDMRPSAAPEEGVGAFIMTGEGVARLFAPGMVEGPFPEHYEPFETPLGKNPMHPEQPAVTSNPAARVYKGDMEVFGKADEFPYVATTYRLAEHFHFWTKTSKINAILQPEHFIEISEELAGEKGIRKGDVVKVTSNRGYIKAVAVVTKRIPVLTVDGRKLHTVGIPIHFGFKGETKPGYITNTLTPVVGDANCQTPEYKAFLVNIEKA
jgi:formate dehydrogenase major subunit